VEFLIAASPDSEPGRDAIAYSDPNARASRDYEHTCTRADSNAKRNCRTAANHNGQHTAL
jgi:hypothetical protein